MHQCLSSVEAAQFLLRLREAHLLGLKARGALPEWMTIKKGYEFCTLCSKYADEKHLSSAKHMRYQRYFEQQAPAVMPAPPAPPWGGEGSGPTVPDAPATAPSSDTGAASSALRAARWLKTGTGVFFCSETGTCCHSAPFGEPYDEWF